MNWLVESRTDCTRSTNGALLLLLLLLVVVVVVVVVVVDGWLVGWLVGLVFNLIFSSYSVYILRQHVFACLIMTMTPNSKILRTTEYPRLDSAVTGVCLV